MSTYFVFDRTYRIAGPSGLGARVVVFIPDEFAATSVHPDAVVCEEKTPTRPYLWVKDGDIVRARDFGDGIIDTQSTLVGVLPEIGTQQPPPGIRARENDLGGDADSALPPSKIGAIAAKLAAKIRPRSSHADHKEKTKPDAKASFVYGFWQTALHNDAADLTNPLNVVLTGPKSGLFLLCENGRPVRSGVFRAGMVPGYDGDFLSASIVNASDEAIRAWKAPPEPCLTSAERLRERQKHRDAKAGRLMLGAGVGVVAAIVVYMGMSKTAVSRSLELSTLDAQVNQLQAANTQKKKFKFTSDSYPDGESVTTILAVSQLYYGTQGLTFDWQNLLSVEFTKYVAAASPPRFELAFEHSQTLLHDGTVVYSWDKGQGRLFSLETEQ